MSDQTASTDIHTAKTEVPILEVLAKRWSPYVYEPKPVERQKIRRCLEAARWAASSYNEQPWSFILAYREQQAEFAKLLDCLVEANQVWAQHAGLLMLTVVCPRFRRNENPNRVAEHDVGLAMGNFSAQATAEGLYVHQMAGVQLDKARTVYGIPETHAPLTGVAVGYLGANADVPEALAERDRQTRSRLPLQEFVFAGKWKQPAEA